MSEDQPTSAAEPRKERSVRFRLLAIALLPMLFIVPLLLGITMLRWNGKFDTLLITKVNSDLTIAHQYFTQILDNTGERINALGRSAEFRDALTIGSDMDALLEDKRKQLGLDFLYIYQPGRDVSNAAPASARPIDPVRWPAIEAALSGTPETVIDIFSHEDLAAISPALAEQASFDLIDTPNAVPTERKVENRGMVIHSASPVILPGGRPAALVGGTLLNGNLAFIDTINDLVYKQASLPAGSQGTATLFLDDVRVSTNVRLFENRRALGTRVSRAVRETVLGEGRVWLNRAFVVNDWYISAYEPITDSFGKRVGMLYVGFLEAPFRETKLTTIVFIAAAFVIAAAISIPIFLRWASGIFLPLERMTATIGRVEGGDLSARTAIERSDDEIARVAFHLDELLDQIQSRDKALREWNEALNDRVEERTRELRRANDQLEAATRQLILSEKLAAIGEITAGVAHEINNPIAVMQGNLDVLRSTLGENAKEVKTEIALIDEQINRIHLIVTKLLQFARPEEYAGSVDRHSAADVVADCIPLVQHLLNKADIEVKLEHHSDRLILMNRTELQQILVNLIVNALHAMPNGGTLTLKDRDHIENGKDGVLIEVEDTGIGMDETTQARIFDPFFTTKKSEGTGLGLSISQQLIARQSGRISVKSKPGEGTTFSIWLPEAN
ncbi:HAMP domain-containing sensor histidine kinase [Rhizobium sp. L1K21]|uniref:sensor histidine kinase n=1 Tax=Rhizobium sp. L1K21 TaxID=2954933 RepID=UPI002092E2CC|nr:HAMP domain-containing sensor histidine kinase [Rhizobium sp. L1K21]MCO6185272.1 cache domain-containing protein [Rhizobium sp. L1K21]